MIPVLPSNLSTITPVVYDVAAQLERLRRFDTYWGRTSPEREREKLGLENLLKPLDKRPTNS